MNRMGVGYVTTRSEKARDLTQNEYFVPFVINLISFLQGASLPVSCVLITQLKAAENDTVDLDSFKLTRKIDEDLVMVEEPIETALSPPRTLSYRTMEDKSQAVGSLDTYSHQYLQDFSMIRLGESNP